MPTKLGVFNSCMRILAQPLLVSPDDQREDARQLRDAFEPAVNACYEAGNWKSGIKRVQLSRLDDAPVFGYQYYYGVPNDFIRLVQISSSGQRFDDMILYEFEGGKIATDATQVFLRYVARDLISLAPGSWTQAFADYVSARMAFLAAPKVNSGALSAASQMMEDAEKTALAVDAVRDPPELRRPGSFVRAVRMGNRGGAFGGFR